MVKRRQTSRDLIARAVAASRVTAFTKVRLSRDLYRRACACASDVDEAVGRWLFLCTLPGNLGRAQSLCVAIPDALLCATRDAVVATVEGVHPDHDVFRRCVATVVLYCESKRFPPFECSRREGVDYFVEREN